MAGRAHVHRPVHGQDGRLPQAVFPVFLLGAIFGKLIEISGFSKSIVAAVIRLFGPQRAMLSIVVVCALLTYGGSVLFVVVFAVYPFAAELFRQSDIPKRLIPGTIALAHSPSPWMRCRAHRRSRTSFRPPSSAPMPGPLPCSAPWAACSSRSSA
ncbi:hypothetical protein [Dokdonella sp.]|uniref:GntT/GntP/DsdX family permease n=1 Tax=Dokdonella sp. TaxID=2291710 RepID=UPI0031B7EB87